MKKVIALLLVLVLALSLSACGGSDANKEIRPPVSSEESTEEQKKAPDINKYSMAAYNGLTLGDVAAIWGDDYAPIFHISDEGWGYVEYEDERCPFRFCVQAEGHKINVGHEQKLTGVKITVDEEKKLKDFFVTEGISIYDTYSQLKSKLTGKYYDRKHGGSIFESKLENGVTVFWELVYDSEQSDYITVSFVN